jgi:glycosyltransferase involved in cell wall biosynthesis
LIDTYGCPADKVTVIRNGWAGTPLPRSPSTVPTVVSVGNLRPEKGHKVLLKAFEKVVKELPVARLVLVGEGPLRGELEDVVTDLGLVGNVEFAGARPEVWSSLAAADVFALASFSEPLGLAVLEAMAAGLPVVATSVGGVPELVTTNVTGKLVPSGDEGALSAALLGFLRDKRSAEKMGRESRKRADSMRATAMIDSYFSLYEEMLDGGGRNDGIRSGRYPDGGKP